MSNDNTDCDDMPERIWLIPDIGWDGETAWSNDPPPEPGMDPDDAVEYRRADLCASGQQVRALEARPWVVFDAVFRFLKDDAKTQEVFDAITSALTPAPGWQPIETAPHETLVVLGWYEGDVWKQEIALASAGTRYPNGCSDRWQHGRASHWRPLPDPPTTPEAEGGSDA